MRSFVFSVLFVFSTLAYSSGLSFDFKSIPVSSALQLLADYKKLNVVVSNGVSGDITMKLHNVTWDEAFSHVTSVANLDYDYKGDTLLVYPFSVDVPLFDENIIKYPPHLIPLTHILPSELSSLVHLYPDEFVLFSDDLSHVVAYMPSDRLSSLIDLVRTLDVPRSQLYVQANIVEVSRDYVDSLGVNWGSSSLSSGSLTFEGSSSLAVASGAALKLGYVSSSAILDARLNALESSGNGRVISSPKVFVFDRRLARVSRGSEVPYQELQSDGVVTTSFKSAHLSLEVRPVVSDGFVLLDIHLTKDEPDYSVGTAGAPPINTSSFTSSVRLLGGETVALGGITTSSVSKSVKGVPGLSRVPLLGKLFRYRSNRDSDSELFLFISVSILD